MATNDALWCGQCRSHSCMECDRIFLQAMRSQVEYCMSGKDNKVMKRRKEGKEQKVKLQAVQARNATEAYLSTTKRKLLFQSCIHSTSTTKKMKKGKIVSERQQSTRTIQHDGDLSKKIVQENKEDRE